MSAFGNLLAISRKAKGLTPADLAIAMGATEAEIYRYEAGIQQPSVSVARAAARALDVTEGLLWRGAERRDALGIDSHIRRPKAATAAHWRRAEARLNLFAIRALLLLEQVVLRSERTIPRLDGREWDAQDAARMVRAQWGMPRGPVGNLTSWVESAGALIIEDDLQTHRIDGLSQWRDGHPFLMLNAALQSPRRRLTLSHELGHLVLHSRFVPEDSERQANAFAHEFLMPKDMICHELRHRDLGTLLDLKREWNVPMMEIFDWAVMMGMATRVERATIYPKIKTMKERHEPGDEVFALERPRLVSAIGKALRTQGCSDETINALSGYSHGVANPFNDRARHLRMVLDV